MIRRGVLGVKLEAVAFEVLYDVVAAVFATLNKFFAGWVAEDWQPTIGQPIAAKRAAQRMTGLREKWRAVRRWRDWDKILRCVWPKAEVERRDTDRRAAEPGLLRGGCPAWTTDCHSIGASRQVLKTIHAIAIGLGLLAIAERNRNLAALRACDDALDARAAENVWV